MAQARSTGEFRFDITATAGDARTGEIHVNGTKISTPNLFPVLNFYAGGMKRSVYGGSVHRTIKELMIGADRVGIGPLNEYFDTVMTSISSLTDYNLTRERYEDYLATPIKDRDIFEPFTGLLFLDSGGFKFLNESEIDGSDFEVEMNQRAIYDIQHALGGDVIVNLDHPITPDDTHEERVEKAEKTAANVHEFLSITQDFDGAKYLTVHGYNYSMMDEFLTIVSDTVPAGILREGFDGIALGSLVPKKDDRGALMQAVSDCREVMADWGMADWPLHVFGISSRAIPLLAGMGADTFDSSAHIHNAINRKYNRSLMERVPVDDADFSECDCPVCESELLVDRMKGNAEFQKDVLGPVAMHNLIVQKRELTDLRRYIRQPGTDAFVDYLEEKFSDDKTMRRFSHQVVNNSLGGYF